MTNSTTSENYPIEVLQDQRALLIHRAEDLSNEHEHTYKRLKDISAKREQNDLYIKLLDKAINRLGSPVNSVPSVTVTNHYTEAQVHEDYVKNRNRYINGAGDFPL